MKYSFNIDIFRIANIIDLSASSEKREKMKSKIENYEKRFSDSITSERRTTVELNGLNPWDDLVFADFEIVRDLIDELARKIPNPNKSAFVSDLISMMN